MIPNNSPGAKRNLRSDRKKFIPCFPQLFKNPRFETPRFRELS